MSNMLLNNLATSMNSLITTTIPQIQMAKFKITFCYKYLLLNIIDHNVKCIACCVPR